MNWQPNMQAVCITPVACLQLGETYRVEKVIHGGRLSRDELNGDGLVVKDRYGALVPIPEGYTGFDARRFLRGLE